MKLTQEQLEALARMPIGEWVPLDDIPEWQYMEKRALIQTNKGKALKLRKGITVATLANTEIYQKYKDIEPNKDGWKQVPGGFQNWTFDALVLYKGFWRAVFTADSYMAQGMANMDHQPPLVRDYLEKFHDGYHFKVVTRNKQYEFLTDTTGKIIGRDQHFREWQAENYDQNMQVRTRKTIIRVHQKKGYDEYNS